MESHMDGCKEWHDGSGSVRLGSLMWLGVLVDRYFEAQVWTGSDGARLGGGRGSGWYILIVWFHKKNDPEDLRPRRE